MRRRINYVVEIVVGLGVAACFFAFAFFIYRAALEYPR